jgi:hypothetical protein
MERALGEVEVEERGGSREGIVKAMAVALVALIVVSNLQKCMRFVSRWFKSTTAPFVYILSYQKKIRAHYTLCTPV